MAGDVSQALAVQQSIPVIQQMISFYLSLAIAAFSLFFLMRNFIMQAKLRFYITKYFFIRVAPFGESLYAHAVMMSSNDNALVKNVYAKLIKTDGAIKQYNLETNMVCEVANQGLVGDYKILSSSPLEIFEKDKVNSRVYVFVISEYKDKIRELSSSLENFIANQKTQLSTPGVSEDQKKSMFLELIKFQIDLVNKVYDFIQIEEGVYNLTMYIEYEKRIACLNYKRKATIENSLSFRVDANYKLSMRDKILQYVKDASIQMIKNSPVTTPLPHYIPLDIVENAN